MLFSIVFHLCDLLMRRRDSRAERWFVVNTADGYVSSLANNVILVSQSLLGGTFLVHGVA